MLPLKAEEILPALEEALGLPGARLELVDYSRYAVPQGTIEFPREQLTAPPAPDPHGTAMWKGFIRYGGNHRFAIWSRVRIAVRSMRVVAAEMLVQGRPIQASQLRLEAYEGFPMRTRPVISIEEAVGRSPRRSVSAGAVLLPAQLDTAYDVVRGDSVRVEVSSGEAHLELDGRAEASGRRGQTIPVRNPANGKSFPARVEARGPGGSEGQVHETRIVSIVYLWMACAGPAPARKKPKPAAETPLDRYVQEAAIAAERRPARRLPAQYGRRPRGWPTARAICAPARWTISSRSSSASSRTPQPPEPPRPRGRQRSAIRSRRWPA